MTDDDAPRFSRFSLTRDFLTFAGLLLAAVTVVGVGAHFHARVVMLLLVIPFWGICKLVTVPWVADRVVKEYADLSRRLGDQLYSSVEQAHGMTPGQLEPLKKLQREAEATDVRPPLLHRAIVATVVAVPGSLIAFAAAGIWAAVGGLLLGLAAARPLADAIRDVSIRFRTMAVTMKLPPPKAVPPPNDRSR